MAAEKQTQKHAGSRFGRLRGRFADAAATAAMNRGRAFGPFIRLGQPANDNQVPVPLLVLRTAVLIALLGLMAAVIL
jgi:hypothetical protein